MLLLQLRFAFARMLLRRFTYVDFRASTCCTILHLSMISRKVASVSYRYESARHIPRKDSRLSYRTVSTPPFLSCLPLLFSSLVAIFRSNRRIPLTILSRRLRQALHVMMIVRNNFGGAPLFECHAIRSSGPATAPRGRGCGRPAKSFDVNFRPVPLPASFAPLRRRCRCRR